MLYSPIMHRHPLPFLIYLLHLLGFAETKCKILCSFIAYRRLVPGLWELVWLSLPRFGSATFLRVPKAVVEIQEQIQAEYREPK